MQYELMNKKILFLFLAALFQHPVLANDTASGIQENNCTTRVFADALSSTANDINENAPEIDIKQWVYSAFSTVETLKKILDCPEVQSIPETSTIKFTPIQYKFPNGRQITVNYETQPKVLKQRLLLLTKRPLPSDNPNPSIGYDSDALWTNTDPAWYGIMIVEHGALDEFVGPEKNNTISLKYIEDNIDNLYPRGSNCTNKSALAKNNAAINRATTNAVDMRIQTDKEDTNDYYVAGDVNLQWISYTEMAFDVVLTVLTWGGGTVLSGLTKFSRSSRALKNLHKTIQSLETTADVSRYRAAVRDAARITQQLENLDDVRDAAQIANLTRDLDNANDTIKTLSKTDDVKDYLEATKTFSSLNKYRRSLRAFKIPQRGNIIARAARTIKGAAQSVHSAYTGNQLIKKAVRLAKSSSASSWIRNRLFDSTMHAAGMIGKTVSKGGALYGGIKILGDMYDYTATSTDQYTNGIQFKPLLLLSADDLMGQENVVNYGVWIMFTGDSMNPEDDDAAYLQAMDFASKLHEELQEHQDYTSSPCNVDIYIVRPILRNPDQENADLFYLIMNDSPWTTSE